MTVVAHLDLQIPSEAHGFRAVLDGGGRARIAKGRDAEHERLLDTYQRAVHLAGLDWIEAHGRDWPHYDSAPIFLGALFWLPQPTTYRIAEVWHRTRKGGPRRWGGGAASDLTTLLRAAEDALAGALYRDDGAVALHLAAKPLLPRGGTPRVELFVAGADDAGKALALMLARLPIRANPTGPTRNSTDGAPVISDVDPTDCRSIPDVSSPVSTILFPSVQNLSFSPRGR